MTDKKIEGLNYATKLSIDDLKFLEESYADLFTGIVQAMMGYYIDNEGFYGILDSSNPRNATPNNTVDLRPFQVDITDLADDSSPFVTVQPGTCITQNGNLLTLASSYDLEVFPTGSIYSDGTTQFVVFAEYEVIDDISNQAVTKYSTLASKRKIINPAMVSSMLLDVWNDSTIVTDERKKNIVVLGVASYVFFGGIITGRTLDLTGVFSQDNRPWFTPVDVSHRLDVGTGSSNTPHRIGLNDLSEGDVTLHNELLTNSSAVYSKQGKVPNCCGVLCTETLGPLNLSTDTDGSITGISGVQYFSLAKFPNKLVGAYAPNVLPTEEDNNDISAWLLPRTNIVVLDPNESIPPTIYVEYTATDSASLDLQSTKTGGMELTVKDVATDELVIAGGKSLTELNTLKYNFAGSNLFPKRFKMYIDDLGDPVASPQMLVCAKQCSDIGTTTQQNNTTPYADGKIQVAVYADSALSGFDVSVTLNGTDPDGTSITETVDVTFVSGALASSTVWPAVPTGTIWSPSPDGISYIDRPYLRHTSTTGTSYRTTDDLNYWINPTSPQAASNVVETYNTFSSLDSWSINNAPTNVYIGLFVNLEPETSSTMRNLLYIGDVLWNGNAISRLYDRRNVVNRLQGTKQINPVIGGGQNMLATKLALAPTTPYVKLYDEYFPDPKYYNRRASRGSGYDQDYISNLVNRKYTYPQNIYTSRALSLQLDEIVTTLGAGDPANLQAYLSLYSDENYYYNDTNVPETYVMCRYCLKSAPQTWSTWYNASRVSVIGKENLLYDLSDALLTPDTASIWTDFVYKFQLKIIGNVTGYSVSVIFNP